MAGVGADVERDAVSGEAVVAERPQPDDRGAETGRQQHRRAAQPQRDDREPQHDDEHRRQQRTAAVGEQHRRQQQRQRRHRQRAQRGVAVTASADPEAAGDPQHRHQADGVPVVERRAQPGGAGVDPFERREDLHQQRPAGQHQRRQHEPADDRRPAPGGDPHERGRAGEGGEVGERQVGGRPRVRRRDRPADRDRRQRRQRAEQQHGEAAPQAAAAGVGQRRQRDAGTADQRQRDLRRRRRIERAAAAGDERDDDDQRRQREDDRRIGMGGQPVARRAPANGRAGTIGRRRGQLDWLVLSRAGERGHVARSSVLRSRSRRRRAARGRRSAASAARGCRLRRRRGCRG